MVEMGLNCSGWMNGIDACRNKRMILEIKSEISCGVQQSYLVGTCCPVLFRLRCQYAGQHRNCRDYCHTDRSGCCSDLYFFCSCNILAGTGSLIRSLKVRCNLVATFLLNLNRSLLNSGSPYSLIFGFLPCTYSFPSVFHLGIPFYILCMLISEHFVISVK
jgi:hypothetical protein